MLCAPLYFLWTRSKRHPFVHSDARLHFLLFVIRYLIGLLNLTIQYIHIHTTPCPSSPNLPFQPNLKQLLFLDIELRARTNPNANEPACTSSPGEPWAAPANLDSLPLQRSLRALTLPRPPRSGCSLWAGIAALLFKGWEGMKFQAGHFCALLLSQID